MEMARSIIRPFMFGFHPFVRSWSGSKYVIETDRRDIVPPFLRDIGCRAHLDPTPDCSAAFNSCLYLRLQDLTKDSIYTYARGQLSDECNLVKMAKNNTAMYGQPVDRPLNEIGERSSGVFLWVALVVKRLRRGLRDGASLEDLLESLNHLPEELDDLYRQMLQGLSPFRKRQASMALQIVYEFNTHKYRWFGVLGLLTLSFALDGLDSNIDAKIVEISPEEQLRRKLRVRRRE